MLGTVWAGAFAPAAVAADTPRDAEWHLDALHMPEVWQTSTGSGVTVAVIDTGFKEDAPDLTGQFLPGKDLSGLPGGVTTDPVGHGTSMASMIAGTGKSFNGKGATGLAPGAKILPIKINSNADPSTEIGRPASLKQIDEGITYAVDQGAKVISISQAIRQVDISPSDIAALQSAVDYAISKGRLVVAGAGNSGEQDNAVMYPAAAPGVAAIAAHDRNGTATSESEHGPYVALGAPGIDIYAVCTEPTGYCVTHGTSDGTALTAASAAVLWSLHPDWTGNQILRVLINTANKPNDGSTHSNYIGFGNISPRNAIHYTGDPGPATVNPLVAAGIGVAPSGAASAPASAPASGAPSSAKPSSGATAAPLSTPSAPSAASPVATAGKSSGSGSLPWILGGGVLALLVVGGVVVLVRRRRAPQLPADLPPAQPPYGQPYPPHAGQPAPPAGYGTQPAAQPYAAPTDSPAHPPPRTTPPH
ncbi:S8 family serine peptidase, partial [Kitasatospora nipponensis]|uniref:S8 family serine peptidase n=1 Tax=Kitasatospora nipponensis TaxID=258049 RepID=UPI0031D68F85